MSFQNRNKNINALKKYALANNENGIAKIPNSLKLCGPS